MGLCVCGEREVQLRRRQMKEGKCQVRSNGKQGGSSIKANRQLNSQLCVALEGFFCVMETATFLNEWSEQEVEFNKRDLLLYAFSLGAPLRYTYEYAEGGFAAFPTYPLCLCFKGNSFDVV